MFDPFPPWGESYPLVGCGSNASLPAHLSPSDGELIPSRSIPTKRGVAHEGGPDPLLPSSPFHPMRRMEGTDPIETVRGKGGPPIPKRIENEGKKGKRRSSTVLHGIPSWFDSLSNTRRSGSSGVDRVLKDSSPSHSGWWFRSMSTAAIQLDSGGSHTTPTHTWDSNAISQPTLCTLWIQAK